MADDGEAPPTDAIELAPLTPGDGEAIGIMSDKDWEAYWDLIAEHDAAAPRPAERARQEERLRRRALEYGVKQAPAYQINARMLPEDRELFRRAIRTWGPLLEAMDRQEGRPIDPLVEKAFKAGQRRFEDRKGRTALRRFQTADVDPARSLGLKADHPAVLDARTIFPTTVVSPWHSPRLLVSGHNNAKLGAKVEKGPWAGFPLYHLTLEERATCPRSCAQWASCYGNAMHMARRHDAKTQYEDFFELLRAETWLLAREHRDGFVVRLHTLGDFFSREYVGVWLGLIDRLPQLHVYGYTANRPDAVNPQEREIGALIAKAADMAWDQFAMRFSGGRGRQNTVVIDDPADAGEAIICPAQHSGDDEAATDACSTCGLCWADSARDKTIAFLRHGMKGGRSTKGEGGDASPSA